MKADDFVPVWQRWDARPGREEQVSELVMYEQALGLSYGLPHHKVHEVLTAWRRAGLTHHQSFDAFVAGARTLMP